MIIAINWWLYNLMLVGGGDSVGRQFESGHDVVVMVPVAWPSHRRFDIFS